MSSFDLSLPSWAQPSRAEDAAERDREQQQHEREQEIRESMRPTCDVEAAAEALWNAVNASLGTQSPEYCWENAGLVAQERYRTYVRAVLAHVHPQPREQKP